MTAHVVHLLFHGIGRPGRDLEPGEDAYWITESTFFAVLDEITGRPEVRLSFDDGNASDVEIALPALLERGLHATFFVLAGRLDLAGSLDPEAVRDLHTSGMGIGSHGMDHLSWRGLTDATGRRELVDARVRLREVVGGPVDEAAAPFGLYDRRALARLRKEAYAAVYTSDRRWAVPGSWLQPRFSVRRDDTLASVRADVLTPPSWQRRLERGVVGALKRLR